MNTPSTAQSLTLFIRKMQDGRDSAAEVVLEAYFQRLVHLVRKRLQGTPGLDGFEEDVALQSFDSMCRRLRCLERPVNLASRDDFWRLLATRAVSRAIDLIRRHKPGEVPGAHDVENLLTRMPTPEEAAEMADECRRLLDMLDEPDLRQIALWKVEGYTHEEIAERLDCVPRTIERKVSRIRLLWKHELKELDS
jgi:RNA polymerase sigma factor (sigma-70 family)